MKLNKHYLITIDKKNNVFLNFDKPVGRLLLEKIIEIQEIIEKDAISIDGTTGTEARTVLPTAED